MPITQQNQVTFMFACEKQFNQKLYYTLCSDSTKMKYHFVKAVAAAILTIACRNNSVTTLEDLLTSSLLILAHYSSDRIDPNLNFEISLASRAFKSNH